VAPRSISEWPASERMASEPVEKPTKALAMVSPAEAAIEDKATCSFSACMARRCTPNRGKFREWPGTARNRGAGVSPRRPNDKRTGDQLDTRHCGRDGHCRQFCWSGGRKSAQLKPP